MSHTRQPSISGLSMLLAVAAMSGLLTGCATTRGPRSLGDGVMMTATSWSRVVEVHPGTQISIATTRTARSTRIFVAADSSTVTVVNLDGPSLTLVAMRAVRDMATRHPERFIQMLAAGSLEQDGVRLGRDGLFVGNRRIAEFAQVVETFPRESVREIRGPVVARGSTLGTLIGAWLGFTLGAVPALGGADAAASLFGGITLGGWLGHHWSNHTEEGLVYSAR